MGFLGIFSLKTFFFSKIVSDIENKSWVVEDLNGKSRFLRKEFQRIVNRRLYASGFTRKSINNEF